MRQDITIYMHDTVNERPESADFDAVLSCSLTVGGLCVTCAKAHGRPVYCHPCFVLVVPGAWTIDRPMSAPVLVLNASCFEETIQNTWPWV